MHCWYNTDRKCTQPRDCKIADLCLDCWNPATTPAMRVGPLWFWADRIVKSARAHPKP